VDASTAGEGALGTSAGAGSGTGSGTGSGMGSGTSTGMSTGSGSGIDTGDPTDAGLAGSDSATTGGGTTGSATGSGTVGHDTSGPTTDSAMTRSEEHLEVGTRTRESARARLRKYVVTESETVTVPVSHEEVRLETEPITDANAGAAMDGPAISEEEHEVVLHQEVPVVTTEARPVERVRLGTETVTGEEQVTEDVRKERIDLDGGTEATTGDEPPRRS
jgi:uncharacterized protein (TIGR02271 family)